MSELKFERIENKITEYLKIQKRIQRLLKKSATHPTQEEEILYYIVRLSNKAKLIETHLKEEGIIEYSENLSEWPSQRLRGFLM
jgi:hypothetical protein